MLHCMWDLARAGIEPVFPALAASFLSTAPPGKSPNHLDFLEEAFGVKRSGRHGCTMCW